MPNRIIREGILSSEKAVKTISQLRAISMPVRKRIWGMPCVVCGVPYFIKCDHIIPVAHGGDGRESNIQPLCHDCNHIKGSRLSNEEVRVVVLSRGLKHFLSAAHRQDTRFINSFERPSLVNWLGSNRLLEEEAARLYLAFSGGMV